MTILLGWLDRLLEHWTPLKETSDQPSPQLIIYRDVTEKKLIPSKRYRQKVRVLRSFQVIKVISGQDGLS